MVDKTCICARVGGRFFRNSFDNGRSSIAAEPPLAPRSVLAPGWPTWPLKAPGQGLSSLSAGRSRRRGWAHGRCSRTQSHPTERRGGCAQLDEAGCGWVRLGEVAPTGGATDAVGPRRLWAARRQRKVATPPVPGLPLPFARVPRAGSEYRILYTLLFRSCS